MENKIKHLEMIQGVINRMASNSFLLKGWSVVLVSALFALSAKEINIFFMYLAFFPALSFWELDGYFLWQEKLYRKLYDKIRKMSEQEIDFSMDTSTVNKEVKPWVCVTFSKTLRIFHGTIVGAIVIVMLIGNLQKKGVENGKIEKWIEQVKLTQSKEGEMGKAKVFISFDYDNDRSLKDLLVGQAKNEDSPFEIWDGSLKESMPERDWKEKAEEKIKRVDILCVIAGEKTHRASGVLKEIGITDNLNGGGYDIKKFQLIGYSDKECPHVEGAGRRIAWTWDNLKSYLKK